MEPIVRDAGYRARKLAEQKWRRLFTGAAKAFGLTGAAFVDSKLLGKAVQQALETSALMLGDVEDKVAGPRMTAEFVLTAQTLIGKAP